MKTRAEAAELAEAMTTVGRQMGVVVSHLLSPMDEPPGRAVGNALEVAEAVEALQGRGPKDLVTNFALSASGALVSVRLLSWKPTSSLT